MSVPLPIDAALPEIVRAVRERGAAVVRAAPGAGKTTRVPAALLDAGLGAGREGEVLVLEPRRLAARLAARRVAEERGERPGETVGWQVRFEDVGGPATRLRFLTEGVLARRLATDPELRGVGSVVLDEFHERHIHGDLALGLLARLRAGRRPDLRLVVMSATLDAGPVAEFLGGAGGPPAPAIDVPGRAFDVAIEHAAHDSRDPLEWRVRDAFERVAAAEPEGAILVFLPGAAEIARSRETCAAAARERGFVLATLHGSLPPEEQDRAVRPAPGGARKLILSTNVAESSVTIPGVRAVIDSGLARTAAHSPWTGLPRLVTEPVSRASAAQRAGRAGRTGPGRCVRLYTKRDHDMRPAFQAPEVARVDLAETVLSLAAAGVADPAAFGWFEPPPAAALAAARTLLERLGALERAGGGLTPVGRRMLRYPVHPRLARAIVAGEDLGATREACALAAELSEREGSGAVGAVRAQLERIARGGGGGRRDIRSASLRVYDQRARSARAKPDPDGAHKAALAGFPDRVARRRTPRAPEVVLFEGGTATLARETIEALGDDEWLVALDAEDRPRGGALVRAASPIEPDWLLDLFPDHCRESVEAAWNAPAERVVVTSRLLYGSLVLDERRGGAAQGLDSADAGALLEKQALAAGPAAFVDPDELRSFLARLAFARTLAPTLPALGEPEVREALAAICRGRRSFAEIRDAGGLLPALRARLSDQDRRALASLAPEAVALPSGRRAPVLYEPGRPPRVSSRLQDFFGLREGPRVGAGKVPLVLELLAPSRRPVQVTSDLAGFWERHYPAIRRELSRKYPRHKWPEDPLAS